VTAFATASAKVLAMDRMFESARDVAMVSAKVPETDRTEKFEKAFARLL